MSSRAANNFLAFLSERPELQSELAAAAESSDSVSATLELAGRHGFEFSAGDFSATLEAVRRRDAGELLDEELEAAAGGIYSFKPTVTLPGTGGSGGKPVPTEDVTINFQKIAFGYKPQDDDSTKSTSTTWNVKA